MISKEQNWPVVRLGDCVDLLSGFPFKSQKFTDNREDIPLVKGANVHQGFIDWADSKYWPMGDSLQYEKYFLSEDDVVLAMDRPWIEAGLKFSWIRANSPKALLVQRVSRLRGTNGLDSQYLRYVVGSIPFTDYIKSIVTGINVPHISGEQIKSYRFPLPPVKIQLKLAGILSAYDDLIENNTRRIAILESMAQALYQEWFVHFRFPGHENVPLVDSVLGKIPQGWAVRSIGEVSQNFDRLRKPLSSIQRAKMPGSYPYYGAAKVFDHIDNYIFDGKYLLVAEDGSVITPARKPVLQLVYGKFWANNHAHIVRGQGVISTEHLFLSLSNNDVSGCVTGAAQPKITQANLNRIPFVVAEEHIQIEFCALLNPFFDERRVLLRKIETLRKIRDLLLPKLISGQIDVEHLDIDTGASPEEVVA